MSKAVELLAIPNVSEGRDARVITSLVSSVRDTGALVLDVHSDPVHNRSVISTCGNAGTLIAAMTSLAVRCSETLDLTEHEGVHPRLGVLDVCPFVPWATDMDTAIETAHEAGRSIAHAAGVPVYHYAMASSHLRQLSDLRRAGLTALIDAPGAPAPDHGDKASIDPRSGVVCVGARYPLIAFNVWLRADVAEAREIATEVRGTELRALGLEMGDGEVQVSMNLVAPDRIGIETAFDLVAGAASLRDKQPHRTELVGLCFERHLPDPGAQAARLMVPPGRSYESALEALRAGD